MSADDVPQEHPQPFEAKARRLSLDSIGQRNETVRQRIGEMSERLEELKSLRDDFSSILEPMAAISEELPRASMRIAELEVLFAQERHAGEAARREAVDLTSQISTLGSALADATAWSSRNEAELRERDAAMEELRIALREKSLAAESFERQLFAETDQAKALLGENRALRSEAQAVDQALSRSAHELTETRERLELLEREGRRLQLLTEDQNGRLLELGTRYEALDATAEAERQRLRILETHLASETAAREKAEDQYEAEIGEHRAERASLAMKLEAALNRAGATEQLLTQVRNQLREKDEAARAAERNFKEAGIERVTAERRLEGVQTDLARQTERFLDMQRHRTELDSRCDMLAKALAAKDAGLEQAALRNAALGERIDQMTQRYEAERSELAAANRRLVEDLQNERSERAMAQGALDISRESRLALQKQHEALKRSARGWRGGDSQDQASVVNKDADTVIEMGEADSNVRPFTGPGKTL